MALFRRRSARDVLALMRAGTHTVYRVAGRRPGEDRAVLYPKGTTTTGGKDVTRQIAALQSGGLVTADLIMWMPVDLEKE